MPRLAADADEHAASLSSSSTTPRRRRRWRQRLQNAGAALATAALVASPRGPAQAAEAVSTTLVRPKPGPSTVDMDALVGRKLSARYRKDSFLFSEELTSTSPLAEELSELERATNEQKVSKALTTAVTYGASAGAVYVAVQGAMSIERWMREAELKDIEAERELTGQYISVDAGDVETSIDPTTGKNLTIARNVQLNKEKEELEKKKASEEPKKTPWLLKVLGLGAVEAADDDSFWSGPAPTVRSTGEGGGGEGGGEGGVDGGEGGEGGDDDDDSDDSGDLDDLGDLLGGG